MAIAALKEGHGTSLAFVGLDLAGGDTRGIVDADVDELPSDAAAVALAGSICGDAMVDLVEFTKLFDVDMASGPPSNIRN